MNPRTENIELYKNGKLVLAKYQNPVFVATYEHPNTGYEYREAFKPESMISNSINHEDIFFYIKFAESPRL